MPTPYDPSWDREERERDMREEALWQREEERRRPYGGVTALRYLGVIFLLVLVVLIFVL